MSSRPFLTFLAVVFLVVEGTVTVKATAGGPPQPYSWTKAAREHVEEVGQSTHDYVVTMGGALDGFNTVDYLDTYSGHMRQESRFEPNDYLILENVGDVSVSSPRIVINGRRDWHSADSILAGAITDDMSDAEKAMALFRFASRIDIQAHDNNRRVGPPFPSDGREGEDMDSSHPSRNMFQERANPVKAANSYYCSGCSLSAANLVILWRHAGLTARAVWMSPLDRYETHCVSEAWYDGGWHLFDPERRAFFLREDNTTIASYEDLHRNPQLEARTVNGGFSATKVRPHADDYAAHYPPRIMAVEQWLSTMDLTLRPGETLVYRWDDIGKYRYGANPRQKHDQVAYHLANGKLMYRPRLEGEVYQRGIVAEHNLVSADGVLHPHVATAPGSVTYRVNAPYPIIGGLVGGRFSRRTKNDACRIYVSVRDSDWIAVWSAEGLGEEEVYTAIDDVLDPLLTPPIYTYYVKFELDAAAGVNDARLLDAYIETDLQMADTSLPALSVGANRISYRAKSAHGGRVRVTHGWHESNEHRPPTPPAAPVSPGRDAQVSLSALERLAWKPAQDPEDRGIADYHIQVSPDSRMRWPVSPNLDRILLSGDPQWTVPEGWLVPGRTYYWRVRAKDLQGAWSNWSAVWSFKVL